MEGSTAYGSNRSRSRKRGISEVRINGETHISHSRVSAICGMQTNKRLTTSASGILSALRGSTHRSVHEYCRLRWNYLAGFCAIKRNVFLRITDVLGVSKNDRKMSCTTVVWAARST